MSRNKGDLDFSANIEVLKVVPLDARQLVGTKADLTGATTWNQSGDIWLFDGAIVSVGSDSTTDNNGIYFLSDAVNYNNIDNWEKVGSGSGSVTSASNGLCITGGGTTMKLGGTLSETTTISGNTQNICFGTTTSCLNIFDVESVNSQVQGDNVYINAKTQGHYKGGSFCICMNQTAGIVGDNRATPSGLEYKADYSQNYHTLSIPNAGYVTGYTQSAITSSINTVGVCNVITNYTATTSNDFIGVSGATEIWLPSSPKSCQRIIVADICGNALVANICIIGNGLCINGNDSATINTEYGAMTFINNGYSWSAVAFIN